jgi:transposase
LRFCLDLLLDELTHAQEQVRRVSVCLRELAEVERHRKATVVLCSVPGVGVITAAAFRLELPEPERFDHEGQVAGIPCVTFLTVTLPRSFLGLIMSALSSSN